MQLGHDSFEFRRQSLLKARAPLDFTYETSIEKLVVSGTEPEGSSRRVVFEIDGRLYKFVNGSLDVYDERGEFEDILREGNTVGELLALSADSLSLLVGKRVYPWIAMYALADSPVMPKIKISAQVKNYNDLYTVTRYSPIYTLKRSGEACKIAAVQPNLSLNGNGVVNVKCKLCHPVTGWSPDWIDFIDAKNQLATAIQLQIRYIVTTMDGSDLAKVNAVDIVYTTDSEQLSGATMEIVTLPQEFYSDLETVYALIKTGELIDCELKAYAHFGAPNIRRDNVVLGAATGTEQTVQLIFNGELDVGIIPESIHLTAGGKVIQKFDFDTQAATLTFTGESGTTVVASYERCGEEDWTELLQDFSLEDEGTVSTRFIGRLDNATGKSVSAVKFRLIKKTGSVENESLGVGTGKEQAFALPHYAKGETIQCSGSWRYDESTQILRVVAGIGEDITVSYDWVGNFPEVKSYIAGWEAKVS